MRNPAPIKTTHRSACHEARARVASAEILNEVTSAEILNEVTSAEILNEVTSAEILNQVAVLCPEILAYNITVQVQQLRLQLGPASLQGHLHLFPGERW